MITIYEKNFKMRRKFKRKFRKKSFRRKGSLKKTVMAIIKKNERKTTELKYRDNSNTGNSIDWSGHFVDLSAVPQGISDNNRVGDKLKLHGLYLNFTFRGNNAVVGVGTTTPSQLYVIFRLIIFQWKPATGSYAPSYSDILVSTTQGTTLSPLSPYNWDKRDQFRIVKDKRFKIGSQASAVGTSIPQEILYKKYLRLDKLHEVSYNAGLTTGNWKLYYLLTSDNDNTNSDWIPSYDFNIRVTYTDK